MKPIYGPVPSWRLGRSLGVDHICRSKTCSFDCIYCQLGRTIKPDEVQIDTPLRPCGVKALDKKEIKKKKNKVKIQKIKCYFSL